MNDYRNRVELPVMGVFLQPDPIGFKGDAANIYRFCNNNGVNRTDPTGLTDIPVSTAADRAGVEASLRSYYEGLSDTQDPWLGRGALVFPGENGEYAIGNRVKGQFIKNPIGQSTGGRLVENYGTGGGSIGVGHVHYDWYGRPGKNDAEFSKDDYSTAETKTVHGQLVIGGIVWKVNESSPNVVKRLTPQTTPGRAQPRTVNGKIVKDVQRQLAAERARVSSLDGGNYSTLSQAINVAAWDRTYGTFGFMVRK